MALACNLIASIQFNSHLLIYYGKLPAIYNIKQIQAITSRLITVLLLLLVISGTQCFMSMQDMYGISHQHLMHKVSQILKTKYLQKFEGELKTQYSGILFGIGQRPLISMPARLNDKSCPISINIIFKVDPGNPISALTTEALNKLYKNCPNVEHRENGVYSVLIAGLRTEVIPSQTYSQTVNILASDFLAENYVRLEIDYLKFGMGEIKLLIDGSKLKDAQKEEEL